MDYIYPIFFSVTKGPTLETLDFTFYIGSTPNFLYFDLYYKFLSRENGKFDTYSYEINCHNSS